MIPTSFRFVALGAAHQLKGYLYGFKPSRTAPAPSWTDSGAVVESFDVGSPITDPAYWADRYALCTLTFRKQGGEQLVMNDAVVAISRKKNVISTPMVGMTGTIKEYVNAEDYQLSINVGVQAVRDGVLTDEYPSEGIRQLRSFFDTDEAIKVNSAFLEIFDIDSIVITGFALTQMTESNYQQISISALSDDDYNVYSEEY